MLPVSPFTLQIRDGGGGGSERELPKVSSQIAKKLGKDLGGLVWELGILLESFRFYGLSPRDPTLVLAV